MTKHTFKILRCKHRKVFKVYLFIFQYFPLKLCKQCNSDIGLKWDNALTDQSHATDLFLHRPENIRKSMVF